MVQASPATAGAEGPVAQVRSRRKASGQAEDVAGEAGTDAVDTVEAKAAAAAAGEPVKRRPGRPRKVDKEAAAAAVPLLDLHSSPDARDVLPANSKQQRPDTARISAALQRLQKQREVSEADRAAAAAAGEPVKRRRGRPWRADKEAAAAAEEALFFL